MPNPVPVKLALVTSMGAVPEFVSVTDCELLVSRPTFPKLMLAGLRVRM
jgi:hypothetical protein